MQPTITVNVNPTATVVYLSTNEQVYGSTWTVELDNSDGSLNAVNYAGKPITVSMSPGGGIPAGYVWAQEKDSREGKQILRLICTDAWALLQQCKPAIGAQYWNNPGMLEDGVVKTRFTSYWNKNVSTIISSILSATISASLSGGSSMPNIKPQLAIFNAASGVRKALAYCPGYLRVSGLTFTYINPASQAVDYTYRAVDGETKVTIYSAGVVVPNRIYVESVDMSEGALKIDDPVKFTGHAQNNVSYAALGVWIDLHEQIEDDFATSEAACNTIADAMLEKKENQAAQGEIVTTHTHSQNVLDEITGIDARGNSVTGIVMQIRRIYDRGKYEATFILGGAEGSSLPPATPVPPSFPGETTPIIPKVEWWEIPHAIQGFHHDVHFVAVDYNTVSWDSDTIKFYDGTTQAVSAGSTTLYNSLVHYIYFDLDDASPNVLKVTTDYLNVMSEKTGVLCLIQRGSTTSFNATVIPSYGKEPLLTPDVIYITGGIGGDKLSTLIYAGTILLSKTTGDATHRLVSDDEKATWDGKIVTFFQNNPPTAEGVGDFWVDTNDKNKMYRWSGSSWVIVRDSDIAQAILDAATAQATADGKITTFYQASEPTAEGVGDLWVDTDDSYKLYRWNGSAWVAVLSARKVFRQPTEPTSGMEAGDLWLNTDDGDKPYTYSGSQWVASYTKIDGGNITTGTINCSVVNISAGGAELSSGGIKITGQDLIFYYGGGIVGYLYGVSYGLALLGEDNVIIYTTSGGGTSIGAGSMPSTPTASDLRLEADDEIHIEAGDRMGIGSGGLVPNPAPDNIVISANNDFLLAAVGVIHLTDDAMTDDLDAESTIKDIGAATEYDEIYCDHIHTSGGVYDFLDDLALIRAIKSDPNDPAKVDMNTIPDILKYDKVTYIEKASRKIDSKIARHRQKLTDSITSLEENQNFLASEKSKYDNKLSNQAEAKSHKVARKMLIDIDKKAKMNALTIRKFNDEKDSLEATKSQELVKWNERYEYVSQHFIPLDKTVSLLLGAIRQLTEKVEILEAK